MTTSVVAGDGRAKRYLRRNPERIRAWGFPRAGLLATVLLAAGCAGLHRGDAPEPLYPEPAPDTAAGDYRTLVTELPRLAHERGDRWPLVLWRGVGFEPLDGSRLRELLDRGIVQHLRLSESDVQAAAAVTEAGGPVILMEGAGGAWPYDMVESGDWRLEFPPGASVRPEWRGLPDPTRIEGWERARDLTREHLERYRDAGIDIDAVWLDYEGALLHDDYRALRASSAARRLPRSIVEDEARYRDYRRRHWLGRLSRYLAAPIRRVYPDVSVTNWVVMLSSSRFPVASWTGWQHPPSPPLFFTHTNPIAYGIDTAFLYGWPEGHEINRLNVDRFFTHVLLRQVSADARNRSRHRPDMGAVVWVARWVPDHPGERVPVMSRTAYREALRHIWLRGADAMQVFNPAREGFERYAVWEVADVQQVYDEMLAHREFLERGEVMNFEVPNRRDSLVLWSGLRLDDRALVRITNLGARQKRVYICLAPDTCMNLPVPRHGKTYTVTL